MVGNDQKLEAWLDEGLATWSSYKYMSAVENSNRPNITRFGNYTLRRALNEYGSKENYYQEAYQNGALFWLELEQTLGEDQVQKILRRYLADYKYKIASTQDLLDVIQKETQKDMNDFFKRWFAP